MAMPRNLQRRPAKPALGNGRIQRAVRRAFCFDVELTSSDVYDWVYPRRRHLLTQAHRHSVRRVLLMMADPIRRATRPERVIGPLAFMDQNQRRLSGPPRGLINAPDLPLARKDGVVRPVVVDAGAEAGGVELEGHLTVPGRELVRQLGPKAFHHCTHFIGDYFDFCASSTM